MRILIVDDSLSFRSQIKRALTQDGIEIVGSASNGRVAIDMLIEDRNIDLITLDMNMPVLDGLETIREIKKLNLSPKIIVFASRTDLSARETLEALNLGADDFVVKPESVATSFDKAHLAVQEQLLPKVLNLLNKGPERQKTKVNPEPSLHIEHAKTKFDTSIYKEVNLSTFKPELAIIASSTGGPRALEALFRQMTNTRPSIPILIVQHMPETFTKHLAERLQKTLPFSFTEAVQGEILKPGHAYLAPGNFHMEIHRFGGQNKIKLHQGERVKNVRPCAELLLHSAIELYGSTIFAMVLTGMGDDGADGCKELKKIGGGVMIQDRETSTVWGMPGAVFDIGAYDKVGSIDECGKMLSYLTR